MLAYVIPIFMGLFQRRSTVRIYIYGRTYGYECKRTRYSKIFYSPRRSVVSRINTLPDDLICVCQLVCMTF